MDILFNSKTPEFSWLSNFSPHPVGNQPTAEHAYQASKSDLPHDWAVVRALPTPAAAKSWGKGQHPDGWDVRKIYVMKAVLHKKFTQYPELKWALIGTYPHRLIHLSPWDLFWGADSKGWGKNEMGILLMDLRARLCLGVK